MILPYEFGHLRYLAPELAVFGFAMLVLLHDAMVQQRDRNLSLGVTVLGLAVAGVLNFMTLQALPALDGPLGAFGGMLAVDSFGIYVKFVVLLACLGSLLIGHDFLERVDVTVPEFNPLVLFSAFGMMLMATSNDLMLLFIALEIMSIALYVLCGINRGEAAAAEGAFKYFVMGAFTSCFLLMGIALVYGGVGSTKLHAVAQWLTIDGNSLASVPLVGAGFALLMVGFGFKVAAAPFHMWSPDVYQGAPAPVTALMATGVKAAGFAALGRVVFVAFLDGKVDWGGTLWAVAALTMLLGNIGALVQDDLKRMLAFSSIGHAGYLLMAVAAAPATGLADNPRLGGILFYLLAYTLMNLGAFAVVSLFTRDGREDTSIQRLAGLADRHPLVAAGLSLCLLSLAGIPPTMGFVGKFYLFAAAVEGGLPGLAVVGAVAGAIGVYYYLRPIVLMYMHKPEADALEPQLNRPALGTLAVAAVAMLVLGIAPGGLIDAAREALLSLAAWSGV